MDRTSHLGHAFVVERHFGDPSRRLAADVELHTRSDGENIMCDFVCVLKSDFFAKPDGDFRLRECTILLNHSVLSGRSRHGGHQTGGESKFKNCSHHEMSFSAGIPATES